MGRKQIILTALLLVLIAVACQSQVVEVTVEVEKEVEVVKEVEVEVTVIVEVEVETETIIEEIVITREAPAIIGQEGVGTARDLNRFDAQGSEDSAEATPIPPRSEKEATPFVLLPTTVPQVTAQAITRNVAPTTVPQPTTQPVASSIQATASPQPTATTAPVVFNQPTATTALPTATASLILVEPTPVATHSAIEQLEDILEILAQIEAIMERLSRILALDY